MKQFARLTDSNLTCGVRDEKNNKTRRTVIFSRRK